MAERVLRLNPKRFFFSDRIIHLVNPEKPVVILNEDYVPSKTVELAIQTGVLIDVNGNVLVGKKSKAPAKEAEKTAETPKEEETPVEETPAVEEAPVEEAPVEEAPVEEPKKTKAKGKSKE